MIRNLTYVALFSIFGWLAGVILEWWPPIAGRLEWTVLGGAAVLCLAGIVGVALDNHLSRRRYGPVEDEYHRMIVSDPAKLNGEVEAWRAQVFQYLMRQLDIARIAAPGAERDACLDRAFEVAIAYHVDPEPFFELPRRVYGSYISKHCRWLMQNCVFGNDLVVYYESGEKPAGMRGLRPVPFIERGRDPSDVPPARVPETPN